MNLPKLSLAWPTSDLTKALMADFDRQMSAEISANFGGYFQ